MDPLSEHVDSTEKEQLPNMSTGDMSEQRVPESKSVNQGVNKKIMLCISTSRRML